jgi:hypothetical protein
MLDFDTCNAARLRRFDAAFADLYNEPPSDFRRRRLRPNNQAGKSKSAAA